MQAERHAVWDERLAELARQAKIDLSNLPPKKSPPHKVLLATALKLSTSVSNGWLASRLVMGPPSSVSQFVGRLLRQKGEQARVHLLLSKVETVADMFGSPPPPPTSPR